MLLVAELIEQAAQGLEQEVYTCTYSLVDRASLLIASDYIHVCSSTEEVRVPNGQHETNISSYIHVALSEGQLA